MYMYMEIGHTRDNMLSRWTITQSKGDNVHTYTQQVGHIQLKTGLHEHAQAGTVKCHFEIVQTELTCFSSCSTTSAWTSVCA